MKPYTWRDYWKAQDGLCLFSVSQTYSDIYPWWNRNRYNVYGKLPQMWYYITCRLWHKYTTVTPRDMPPTWTDRRELLLHASFEILMQYVEREHKYTWTVEALEAEIAKPVMDEQDSMSQAWCIGYLPTAKEIEFLYNWWTVARPEREAEYDRRLTVWHDLYVAHRHSYTKENPNWQETDSPHLTRWSLPEDAVEPEALIAARKHMDEMSEEIRDKEDDNMLRRLIGVRLTLWT